MAKKNKPVKEVISQETADKVIENAISGKDEVKPKMNEEDKKFMVKVMEFLGYDLKHALHYDYFVKSGRPMPNSLKEELVMEAFKR